MKLAFLLLTATMGCSAQNTAGSALPNRQLTPGATLAVTAADVCRPGYTRLVRDVPIALKRQVYAEYRTPYVADAYEVDHLIPLELGGSNSLRNLWPESRSLEWSAQVKDDLENYLHALVCAGKLPLAEAQREIATNWIRAYRSYFHTEHPLPPGHVRPYLRHR